MLASVPRLCYEYDPTSITNSRYSDRLLYPCVLTTTIASDVVILYLKCAL